jgi:hypothetical protein
MAVRTLVMRENPPRLFVALRGMQYVRVRSCKEADAFAAVNAAMSNVRMKSRNFMSLGDRTRGRPSGETQSPVVGMQTRAPSRSFGVAVAVERNYRRTQVSPSAARVTP